VLADLFVTLKYPTARSLLKDIIQRRGKGKKRS